jgi:AcrR family transcriptional regulator
MATDDNEGTEEPTGGRVGRQRPRKSPGRRPLSEGDAEDTRRQIRHAAVRLFNERGYAAVSIEDILEVTGLTRGTLYYHFAGKADIFVAGMLDLISLIQGWAVAVAGRQDLSVVDRLRMMAHIKHGLVDAPGGGYPAAEVIREQRVGEAFAHLSPAQHARVWEAFQGTHKIMDDLIAEGVASRELRAVPVPVLHFALRQLLYEPPSLPPVPGQDRRETVEQVLDLFFDGARAR